MFDLLRGAGVGLADRSKLRHLASAQPQPKFNGSRPSRRLQGDGMAISGDMIAILLTAVLGIGSFFIQVCWATAERMHDFASLKFCTVLSMSVSILLCRRGHRIKVIPRSKSLTERGRRLTVCDTPTACSLSACRRK